MADQATLDVNKIFAGVNKEGRPSSGIEFPVTEKTTADLITEAQEAQVKQAAEQQLKDAEDIAEAREIISDLYKRRTEIEAIVDSGSEQLIANTDQEAAKVNIEVAATKIPENLVIGAENTAEVTAFSQETQSLYEKKAQDERALKNEQKTIMTNIEVAATKIPEKQAETGINELVINGIKQKVDDEKIIQENLGKNPEQALTWRAWLSEKLRKMWQIFAQREKN